MIKAAITTVMRTTLTYTEEYDNYAVVRLKLTKSYPIRALDTCASLNMDLQPLKRQSPWMPDPGKQILTSLRCLPKGTGKESIRAEMLQL
jgi:hypothetical protein